MTVLEGPWESWVPPAGEKSATIGVLDGVHLGHRALIERLDRSLIPTVLTFEPHPVEVLRPGTHPRLITTISERIDLVESLGVACTGVLDLAEIKDQTPGAFVEDVLVAKMGITHLVVGEDFRFGHDRLGDVALLEDMSRVHGYRVEPIAIVGEGTAAVSSSRIRALLESGEVSEASFLLGSRFRVSGTVIGGDRRGRDLGFPTANLRPPPRKLVPGHGVYACFATVGGAPHMAAVNVGVRPTFGGGEVLVEAFLLDFESDIYDRELGLEFVERLRPEVAFDDADELVAQIERDVEESRAILMATSPRM